MYPYVRVHFNLSSDNTEMFEQFYLFTRRLAGDFNGLFIIEQFSLDFHLLKYSLPCHPLHRNSLHRSLRDLYWFWLYWSSIWNATRLDVFFSLSSSGPFSLSWPRWFNNYFLNPPHLSETDICFTIFHYTSPVARYRICCLHDISPDRGIKSNFPISNIFPIYKVTYTSFSTFYHVLTGTFFFLIHTCSQITIREIASINLHDIRLVIVYQSVARYINIKLDLTFHDWCTLLLIPWQMFRWSSFFRCRCSDLHINDISFYVHHFPIFQMYRGTSAWSNG